MRTLGIALLSVTLGTLSAAEMREWTSRDGTSRLTARFFRADAQNVTLILPNGRSQVIARPFLSESDLAWIDTQAATTAGGAAPADPLADAPIPAALRGHLIDERGRRVDLARNGRTPKYYLFYYSASWCGPCRAFTPELVRFAKQHKDADFTVVLVPSDRTLAEQIAYQKEYDMPWPGLKLGSRVSIPGNPGRGIPAALLTDADGKTLLSTGSTSRARFLDEAGEILNGGAKLADEG